MAKQQSNSTIEARVRQRVIATGKRDEMLCLARERERELVLLGRHCWRRNNVQGRKRTTT